MFRTTSALAALAVVALALTACTAPPPVPAVAADAPRDVGVELFELPWTSVAQECEKTVGPNGFAWVLTSPAQEHVAGDQWWTSYQPVGYAIDSKLGTRTEFADMVARCTAAGVKVITTAVAVDAPPASGESAQIDADSAAPGGSATDSPTSTGSPTATPSPSPVVAPPELVAYLEDLLALGVAGFRIEGAFGADGIASVPADEVQAVADALPSGTILMSDLANDGPVPPVRETYSGASRIFEYQYGGELGAQLSVGALHDPALVDPRPAHVPSASAVVFIDDHTSERADAAITYRDGPLYLLANVLVLADDYGMPMISSGYAFGSRDAGPPTSADGAVLPASCEGLTEPRTMLSDGDRICPQAWTAIAGMLAWRSAVGDAPRVAASKGGDLYGFERAGRGVVAVNPGGTEGWVIVPTSMPDGEYCDVITGGADALADGACAGEVYKVDNGSVTFHLRALSAAAIDLNTLLP
ncbi:alpha amylase C-terminal domain-containing protein [Microbacterium rhizomatis]|uniref:Alpha-amylase n=1 Tax=Microbacterium rhizomatis TaxID=1631477 RepID=A0A5J5IZI7_9MICO|nr:alpha amylase C-terminal domain-containing protein [Microbacterium rhizomatis]KAA9107736.1 alpha-amylase [Microbacterium rhizomatis]